MSKINSDLKFYKEKLKEYIRLNLPRYIDLELLLREMRDEYLFVISLDCIGLSKKEIEGMNDIRVERMKI